MPRTLQDFVGRYTIRHGQGDFNLIKVGYWLCIGTGDFGDPEPDDVRVGLSIVDKETRQRILPREGNPPVYGYLVDGTLNGSSYWLEDEELPELLSFQVALMMIRQPNGLYKAPSIMVSVGDPQNAGVWGADDEGDEVNEIKEGRG